MTGKDYFKKPPQPYWIASSPTTDYPALEEDVKTDVLIVGGGITGISCAYLLAKEGVKTAVIEADRILQGTTGHTTAKITSQHGLIYNKIKKQMSEEFARQYAKANETAIRAIRDISESLHIKCDYVPEAAYVYTQQDDYAEQIRDEVKAASELGIAASYADSIPFGIPVKAAVRFDGQARFHPGKYLLALAAEASKMGVSIYEQSRVVEMEEGDGYTLKTARGKKASAPRVVIASHYPFYNKAGMYFTRIYPERSYVIAVRAGEKFPGGMYITAEDPGRSLRSQNDGNGELILVGGEHHKTGQGVDTAKHYEALADFAESIFTVEDIPYRWSTQDCMTMDGLPFTGRFTSDTPNLYVATGYGKWGMTNSTASAMILKDLIVDGRSPWEDVYSPSRHTAGASAKNFIAENLNVARELIGGKLAAAPSNPEIRPGEGKVIEADGKKAGAYRDGNGTLHLVNTTCTHMGCELSWNSAEKTWDCPCHGSRFTYEGDIAEGPAVHPLSADRDVNTIEKLLKDKY